ncbi:hypothetical protein Tco_1088570 [Tanacetum coccineum]
MGDDRDVMFIERIRKYDDSHKGPEDEGNAIIEGLEVGYFDTFPTRSELAYHKLTNAPRADQQAPAYPRISWCGPGSPSLIGFPSIKAVVDQELTFADFDDLLMEKSRLLICDFSHINVEKAYIDLNSPLNVMTKMLYNWIMRRKLDPREDINRGVNNFTRRIKGMHFFVGNFTYVIDFMIVEDIGSIIDPRLSQVVLGNPFFEISNMTHDPPKGVVRFTNVTDEIAYKMPHKIEQYNSLSDLAKEHTKSVYLRNEENKRRGVEYVMSKILGFYKECLELGPGYLTRVVDVEEVT